MVCSSGSSFCDDDDDGGGGFVAEVTGVVEEVVEVVGNGLAPKSRSSVVSNGSSSSFGSMLGWVDSGVASFETSFFRDDRYQIARRVFRLEVTVCSHMSPHSRHKLSFSKRI